VVLEGKEVPEELGMRWFAGMQVLPNGNILICNAMGKVPLFEVTREKKVVWSSAAWNMLLPAGHGIQRLDVGR
jgi:hypothetical protein